LSLLSLVPFQHTYTDYVLG